MRPAGIGRQRGRDGAGRDGRHHQDRDLQREARPGLRPDPQGGRRVRRARHVVPGVQGLHRHLLEPVRAVRPEDRARAHHRHGRKHRRSRGEGRRRPVRGRGRVRGARRSGAGAQLPGRAREQEDPLRRRLCGRLTGKAARAVLAVPLDRGWRPRGVVRHHDRVDREAAHRQEGRVRRRRREDEGPHVRAAQLRHPRRRVQGVLGPLLQGAAGRRRADGRSRQLLPQPRVARGRRPDDRQQAQGHRRDVDHLHRRPDLPVVPHPADDPAGLLPRVGDERHGARRHRRVSRGSSTSSSGSTPSACS